MEKKKKIHKVIERIMKGKYQNGFKMSCHGALSGKKFMAQMVKIAVAWPEEKIIS